MPTTKTIQMFKFDELDDRAKERAREWYREASAQDKFWDSVYEDAATIADLMGIDLRARPVKLMGGGTRMEPAIYFSGFSSQGDGACFEGSYRYKAKSAAAVRAYAPTDAELHRIARELAELQRRHWYSLEADIRANGQYSHSGTMQIEVGDKLGDCGGTDDAGALRQLLRDFADWIYRQLEAEHDYRNSDEQVDESIRANEYDFTEEGSRHCVL